MYLQELWKQILTFVSQQIPRNQMLTWFSSTCILDLNNGSMRVGVAKPMAQAWITNKYLPLLLESARQIQSDIREVTVEVDGALMNADDLRHIDITQILVPEKKVRKIRNQQEVKIHSGENASGNGNGSGNGSHISHLLNKTYTLDNFIVGQDNRLPHAACIAVSRKPGREYNPLFIYGGVGLGKTHLLQATGIELLKNYPEAVVVYLTAERFINEVVTAIKRSAMQELRNRYRRVDCLIVDDIQFFARKDRSQEEFFHTFNDLRDAGKQLIVSSDCPPKELVDIEERLKSRFASGMVVEVHFPDFETRLAILQNKCQAMNMMLPPPILECIATNVQDSIRELEGYLTKVAAEVRVNHHLPTVRDVEKMIQRQNGSIALRHAASIIGGDGVAVSEMKIRTMDDIVAVVSEYYRISVEEIRGLSRKREIVVPRQLAMFLSYEILNCSFDTIGDHFHGRNHTTVLHAYHKMKGLVSRDQKIASDTLALKREIGL